MRDAKPEVVIHQLTNIPQHLDTRADRDFAQTNRLRSEGNLADASRQSRRRAPLHRPGLHRDSTRPTAQPATEDGLFHKDAPPGFAGMRSGNLDALEHTVLNTTGIDGIVLRYGYFYGPGTIYAADGSFVADVRKRRVPIIGSGNGVTSFIHVADAAAATVLAMNAGRPGIYNIVDDDPAPIRVWLPVVAALCGAPRPMPLPAIIGRLAAGRWGYYFMTEQRGASNTRAKQQLDWRPQYASWRDGFRAELTAQV